MADVPLTETIKRKQKDIRHPVAMLILPFTGFVSIKKFVPFIQFFESESEQNAHRLTAQVLKALETHDIKAANTIIIPLIMDFDINGQVNKLSGQVRRLKDAVSTIDKINIFPFLGLDPRRFIYQDRSSTLRGSGDLLDHLNSYLDQFELRSRDQRLDFANLKNGDIIGIKLYPPLGFDVMPDPANERSAYITFYKALLERDIPITVHCQEDSFELTRDHDQTCYFTKPDNWARVLGEEGGLDKLRINFAHLGGEDGVKNTIRWITRNEGEYDEYYTVANDVNVNSWTFKIIKMLKQYRNTYSDISAYDFGDPQSVASLLWLIVYDEAGKFDDVGQHKLLDKLLWGSDYPMILSEYKNYNSYFRAFNRLIGCVADAEETYVLPKENQMPPREELFKRLTQDNPKKFLFGA